ncbi:MAG: hypothetical protein EOM20_16625 [Spartobacteria bacterium]|nr:hypothetical protein [Spartobacteria bacterium]
MEIRDHIETYLLEKKGWVKSAELVARFDVKDRALRAVGDSPGLCSTFAISGDQGFKHIANATTREWLRFKHRMIKHAIAEFTRLRKLSDRRANVTKHQKSTFQYEQDTGQGILL